MFKSRLVFTALVSIALCAISSPSSWAQSASGTDGLPAGASSLQEHYGDWMVVCSVADKVTHCLMRQEQRKKDTNQLVLAAQLQQTKAGGMTLTLIMPFGLRLADGVTLQVDDGQVSKPVPFSTCLPVGCISVMQVDDDLQTALRAGTAAKLTAKSFDGGQNVRLGISLKGFTPASARLIELAAEG